MVRFDLNNSRLGNYILGVIMIFIAEIGINHGGDMSVARQMIDCAKLAGADIAKFQMYDPIKILGPQNPNLTEACKAQLSKDQHIELKSYCDKIGIEYCCSIFEPKDVKFLEEIGVKRYKIASRSISDIELLKAIKATGKPVIASNGLDKQLHQFRDIFQPSDNVCVLSCICEYPTTLKRMADQMPWSMTLIGARPFSYKFGLSSHCASIVPSLEAIMHGAEIVEHHVRFEIQKKGCDMSSSITFNQFRQMVEIAKNELIRS